MRQIVLSGLFLFGLLTLPARPDSKIPLTYIPPKVQQALRSYVPGAQLMEACIDSDDQWGTTYEIDYFRGGHQGDIKLTERGRLLDVSEDLILAEVPRLVQRVAGNETRVGALRNASLEQDAGLLVYKIESYNGQSDAKVTLKITSDGQAIERNFD
jgi:hypothetical protein